MAARVKIRQAVSVVADAGFGCANSTKTEKPLMAKSLL
jgi:hypothetical protein